MKDEMPLLVKIEYWGWKTLLLLIDALTWACLIAGVLSLILMVTGLISLTPINVIGALWMAVSGGYYVWKR